MNTKAALNGIMIGLVLTPVWIALLVLIFPGDLSSSLGQASSYFVIGATLSMSIISYFSSWKGVIWIPQSVPVAMLAGIILGAVITVVLSALKPLSRITFLIKLKPITPCKRTD